MKNYRDFNNTMNLKKNLSRSRFIFHSSLNILYVNEKFTSLHFSPRWPCLVRWAYNYPPFFLLILKHQIIVVVLAMAHLCQYLLFMWKTFMPTFHFRGKKCTSVGRVFTKHAQIPVLVPQHKPRSLRSAPIGCIRLLSQKNK